jgi:hypothetical protein
LKNSLEWRPGDQYVPALGQSRRFRFKPVTSGLDSIPDMPPRSNDQPHVPGGDITPAFFDLFVSEYLVEIGAWG